MSETTIRDDRAERLGISSDDLQGAEPALTAGVVDALLEAMVRFEEAIRELAR